MTPVPTPAASHPNAALEALFAGKAPVVHAIYQRITAALRTLGPVEAQPKKTSIHLARGTGFAGIHPHKNTLLLNIRLDRPLQGPRIAKSEQVSRNRYHNEVRLTSPDEVDDELTAWLHEAYHLAGT